MVCNLKNGSCSKCGGCCSNILPLTNNEKNKIKKIIKKRKLKPSYHIPLNGFEQGAVEFYRSLTAKAKPVIMRDLFNE